MTSAALKSSVHDGAPHQYDESLALLARALSQHDETRLDEVAELIGELVAVIEL
jgi:hypothetical protein